VGVYCRSAKAINPPRGGGGRGGGWELCSGRTSGPRVIVVVGEVEEFLDEQHSLKKQISKTIFRHLQKKKMGWLPKFTDKVAFASPEKKREEYRKMQAGSLSSLQCQNRGCDFGAQKRPQVRTCRARLQVNFFSEVGKMGYDMVKTMAQDLERELLFTCWAGCC